MLIKEHNFIKRQEAQAVPSIKQHYGFLDGLRAVAALYVLFGHIWLTVWDNHLPDGPMLFLFGWLRYSHFAVGLFIAISGFCLMLPVARGDGSLRGGAILFFKKRARRILPPYYFALACSTLLATTVLRSRTGTLWDLSIPVTKMGLLAHVLLIHNMFAAYINQIDYPLWSIAVEWQIYFFFPMLVFCWLQYGGFKTATLTVICSYAALFLLRKTTLGGTSPYYLGLFAMGMLAATVCVHEKTRAQVPCQNIPWGKLFIACFVLLIAICCVKGIEILHNHGGAIDFLVGLCSMGALVSAFRSQQDLLRRLLEWKPLRSVGLFSYSLYLIHAPLLQLLWQYVLSPMKMNDTAAFAVLVVVGGPLIVAASYLFFLCFERPFLNWRPAGSGPNGSAKTEYATPQLSEHQSEHREASA